MRYELRAASCKLTTPALCAGAGCHPAAGCQPALLIPVFGLGGPVGVGVLAVQKVEGAFREGAGVFVGAAVARGTDGEVQGFGNARIGGRFLCPPEDLRREPVRSGGEGGQAVPVGLALRDFGRREEGGRGGRRFGLLRRNALGRFAIYRAPPVVAEIVDDGRVVGVSAKTGVD